MNQESSIYLKSDIQTELFPPNEVGYSYFEIIRIIREMFKKDKNLSQLVFTEANWPDNSFVVVHVNNGIDYTATPLSYKSIFKRNLYFSQHTNGDILPWNPNVDTEERYLLVV